MKIRVLTQIATCLYTAVDSGGITSKMARRGGGMERKDREGSGATHEIGAPDYKISVLRYEELILTPRDKDFYPRYMDPWSPLLLIKGR